MIDSTKTNKMKPNIVILLSQDPCIDFAADKKRDFYHDAGRIKVSPVVLSRVIIELPD